MNEATKIRRVRSRAEFLTAKRKCKGVRLIFFMARRYVRDTSVRTTGERRVLHRDLPYPENTSRDRITAGEKERQTRSRPSANEGVAMWRKVWRRFKRATRARRSIARALL